MPSWLKRLPQWLFASDATFSAPGRLIPRWLFLRALGLIYFSTFYSLLRQALGLIGPDGLQPAGEYLEAVKQAVAPRPTGMRQRCFGWQTDRALYCFCAGWELSPPCCWC